ncbi:hypothetical protein V6Z12_A10G084100 [Gossypium hirsutum]
MHGRKAYELVKEFADGEKGHLKIFNNELFERVIEECNEHHNALQSLIRKMQEEGLEVQTARNAEHYGALIHHLSLIRNKRCLMAYVYRVCCHAYGVRAWRTRTVEVWGCCSGGMGRGRRRW